MFNPGLVRFEYRGRAFGELHTTRVSYEDAEAGWRFMHDHFFIPESPDNLEIRERTRAFFINVVEQAYLKRFRNECIYPDTPEHRAYDLVDQEE